MNEQNERIEELQEKEREFILNESILPISVYECASWGDVLDAQIEAERKWNETEEGKELKALVEAMGSS